MSELLIEGRSTINLHKGVITSVSKDNLNYLFDVVELKEDFLIHEKGSGFYLERRESNLYDSKSSIAFTTIHEDASMSFNYIGQEDVFMSDISDKSIEDVYQLLTTVNDALNSSKDCARVFIIHNFKELFKDADLLSKFMDYVNQNNIYVAVD